MKMNYLKEKEKLISIALLCFAAILAISILFRIGGYCAASTRAENIVKKANEQNIEDPNDVKKSFAKYKKLADDLKKKNLFAPPPPKQHPVREIAGIFGDEVIIGNKLYKVGGRVGDAKIVSIEPTQVTIEWDGKKKTFSPMDAGGSSGPGRPSGSRPSARGRGGPTPPRGGSAQMVTVQSQAMPPSGPGGGPMGGMGPGGGRGRFFDMSDADRERFRAEMQERRQRYMNMSEAERERFRAEMRERFGGRAPGGGRRGGRGER